MNHEEDNLDPADWSGLRALGHRMLDDMIDDLSSIRDRPVWRRMPDALRQELASSLPHEGASADEVYDDFVRLIRPYHTGNVHPRFMGWVHGGGNPVGMLAELLAAGMNANLGGRDHAPVEVERQVIRWTAELLGLPAESSGLMLTGSSAANFIGVQIARQAALGSDGRLHGNGAARLTAYTSAAAHNCITRAMEMSGLGRQALRLIPVDAGGRIEIAALESTLAGDRAAGFQPFLIVGTAGGVDTGAVDDLAALAGIAAREGVWFHVDGALGALAMLAPGLRPLFTGIERAGSVALDYHKLGQVPYDAGCIVVRDPDLHAATFASPAAYLGRETRGLAGGHPWFCDFGPDLSRGFRALKVWMTLKCYGADLLGRQIQRCCDLAAELAVSIDAAPMLELLAPVALNIVCFRYRAEIDDLDRLNRAIVADLQEAGIAAPSTTVINGQTAIRAAIVNHRTRKEDIVALLEGVLQVGAARVADRRQSLIG